MEYFVRKDALEAQGISTAQPTSWADLITRAKDWHAKTGLPAITLPAGTQWGGGTFDEGFIHVFLGTGGQLYDDATGKWIVKSQALNDAFDFYAQLASNDLLPTQALLDPQPWTSTKYDGFTGTKADGTTIPVAPPITTQGSWGWIYDWGPAPTGARPIDGLFDKVINWAFPSKAANDTFVWGAEDWMWAISAKSAHPDEAFAFLQCINSGEALATDIAAVGNLAPRDDIQSVKPYADMPYLIAMEKLLPTGPLVQAARRDRQDPAGGRGRHGAAAAEGHRRAGAAALFASEATDLLGADKVEEAPARDGGPRRTLVVRVRPGLLAQRVDTGPGPGGQPMIARRARDRGEVLLIAGFLAPSLLLIGIFVVLPGSRRSCSASPTGSSRGPRRSTRSGSDSSNYRRLADNPQFADAG